MATATYAGTGDVLKRLPYRDIDANSKVSTTDIQTWLDEGEEELNARLQAAQLPAPYTAAAQKTILRRFLVDYVEGRVRAAYASAGGDGGNDDGQKLLDGWTEVLEDIVTNPTRGGEILGSGSAPSGSRRMRGYVLDNDDSKTIADGDFAPTFETGDDL